MSDINARITQLEAAIAAQESLRPTLGDAVDLIKSPGGTVHNSPEIYFRVRIVGYAVSVTYNALIHSGFKPI